MEDASGLVDTPSQSQELDVLEDHTKDQESLDRRSSGGSSPHRRPDSSGAQDESQDSQLREGDAELPTPKQPLASAVYRTRAEDQAVVPGTGPNASQKPQEAVERPDFRFTSFHRRPLELVGKRAFTRAQSLPGGELRGVAAHDPTDTEGDLHKTLETDSMDTEAEVEQASCMSDAPHTDSQTPANTLEDENGPQNDSVQHQEQYTSDRPGSLERSSTNGDDVVFMGHKAVEAIPENGRHFIRRVGSGRTADRLMGPRTLNQKPADDGSARESIGQAPKPRPSSRAHVVQQSTGRPVSDTQPSATSASETRDDTQELLEVVAYKFRQKEQSLKTLFSADKSRVQAELSRAHHDNEILRAQISDLEEKLDQSEIAIARYRGQIVKAKGLQKFLDGLGSDFEGLKRSHDTERNNFAVRLKMSEAEIVRLESALAGKDEYESMLTHSKSSLENLLEARGFELQAVIQHRDMLQAQLEDRVGQLVEERDNRSRLEHLLDELRGRERVSLAAAIDQCTQSVTSKLRDLGHADDQVLLGMSELHKAVQELGERSSELPQESSALRAQLHEIELRISQTASIEASTSTALVDMSASLQSIFEQSMKPLRKQLNHLQGTSEQALSTAEDHSALHERLRMSQDRVSQLELQLDATKGEETSLRQAIAQSTARIEELKSASADTSGSSEGGIAPSEVESKIKEAVAEAQQQLSESANAFIAQEKARFSNELKKATSKRRKAVEDYQAQTKELVQLRTELAEAHALISTQSPMDLQQLEDLASRYQNLELKYQAAQKATEENEALTAKYTALVSDYDAAKSRLMQQTDNLQAQTQDLESCRASLSQIRTMKDQASVDMEVLRSEKDANIQNLRAELSQVEERYKFAEAGLAQMKSSAEAAISQEQERHRKQREAWQHRLDEAQSELQSRSEETESMRKFAEESLKSQQASWQRKYADLETKASESKAATENVAATVEDLRKQLDSAQSKLTSLQKEKQDNVHRAQEQHARETTMSNTIRDLREQHEAAQTKIWQYQSEEQQRPENATNESRLDRRLNKFPKTSQHERNTALVEVPSTQFSEEQQHQGSASQVVLGKMQAASPSQEHRSVTSIVPPKISERPTLGKQRRKADRNTNAIVGSMSLHGRPGGGQAHSSIPGDQVEVTTPTPSQAANPQDVPSPFGRQLQKQASNSASDEMLDTFATKQPVVSSDVQQQHDPAQAYTPWLDFSGNPITSKEKAFAVDASSSSLVQNAVLNPGFDVFEDARASPDGRTFADRVQADFTFRKPCPLPNSASKRSLRTASDKSSERATTSRAAHLASDNIDDNFPGQPPMFPSKSQNMEGSSPDFMNPSATKAKRTYSGISSGGGERSISRRAARSSQRSSAPLLDPRLIARSVGAKRQRQDDDEETQNHPTKKHKKQTGSKAIEGAVVDDSFVARSSQSVSDLPRIQDVNEGRTHKNQQASHMRTSGPSSRATRSQTNKKKGDSFKERFRQELR